MSRKRDGESAARRTLADRLAILPIRASIPLHLLLFAALLTAYSLARGTREGERDVEMEQLERTASQLTMQQSILEHLLRTGRSGQVQADVAGLGSDRDVSVAVLLDDRDVVIASTRQTQVGRGAADVLAAADPGHAARTREARARSVGSAFVADDGAAVVGYSSVLLTGTGWPSRAHPRGVLVVRRELLHAKAIRRAELHSSVFRFGAGALGLALLMWFFCDSVVGARAAHLAATARRFSGGEEGARARLRGRDELAAIGSGYDALLDEVVATRLRIEASERRLRQFVDAAPTPLYAVDEGGRCTFTNPAGTALLGLGGRDQVVGRHLVELAISPAVPAAPLAPGDGAAARTVWSEMVVLRGDGSALPAQVASAPFVADGVHEGTVVAVVDLSGHKKLAESLQHGLATERAARLAAQEAVSARNELLSVAAHELRGPLGTLMLLLDALHRAALGSAGKALPARAAEQLSVARGQIRVLGRLVDNLLDVSRIEQRRLTLEIEPVDLGELVAGVISRLRDELERLRCPLAMHAARGVVGRWDRVRLDQVITNLLSNAMKYGAGKPIEVHVEATELLARLRVRDHGIGIEPEALRRLFTPFERADAARRYGGMGLGLFIVRQIVEALGGIVVVESRPGEGSLFTVELPRGGPRDA